MATQKVKLRFPSHGLKRGAVIETDAATAKQLVADGRATPVLKAEKKD